ncbi:zinc-dependent alcohol dehydrogenase [Paenibacillus humicola]|uniref:zinc-dependent alcohol dehydrogenase n=1 Tax=Paenibacillus humicola TaxID=3110540 RepID=UPI00237A217B|nr:alcohol dehydrogenase catalytic domain-containing protein [Paenibacillus humicola]
MSSSGQMNAIVFEAPGKLSYKKVERPVCRPGQVIVKIHRIGICGTDVEMYRGHIKKATFPITPGHEWSGEIVEVGEGVSGYAVGDRVVGETTMNCGTCSRCRSGAYNLCLNLAENGIFGKDGAACEWMAFPAYALHKFGASISYDQACLIEPSAVAFRGLQRMGIKPGDTLAVIGPGTIGLLTAAAAKHMGVRKVVLVGFQQNRLALGLKLGADDVIDLSRDDYVAKAKEVTGGELFTAIVEASGSGEALERLFAVAAPGCNVCLLGTYGEQLPRIEANKIIELDMRLQGSLSSPGVWDTVVRWMETNPRHVTELITHRLPLERYGEALGMIEARDPSVIKVLLQP